MLSCVKPAPERQRSCPDDLGSKGKFGLRNANTSSCRSVFEMGLQLLSGTHTFREKPWVFICHSRGAEVVRGQATPSCGRTCGAAMIKYLACFAVFVALVGADSGISISSDILSAADPVLHSVIAGMASCEICFHRLVCELSAKLRYIFESHAGLDNSQPATQQVATQLAAKYQSTLQVCKPKISLSLSSAIHHALTTSSTDCAAE